MSFSAAPTLILNSILRAFHAADIELLEKERLQDFINKQQFLIKSLQLPEYTYLLCNDIKSPALNFLFFTEKFLGLVLS